MQNIKFFSHTADVEFESYGATLEKAFENAALALFGVMTNIKKVKPKIKKKINIESEDLESLLYDFLEKFLILLDSENMVFSKFDVKKITMNEKSKKFKLKAEAYGEKFDEKRHESKTLVKAITYHGMHIGRKRVASKEMHFVHALLDI